MENAWSTSRIPISQGFPVLAMLLPTPEKKMWRSAPGALRHIFFSGVGGLASLRWGFYQNWKALIPIWVAGSWPNKALVRRAARWECNPRSSAIVQRVDRVNVVFPPNV